MTFCVACMLDGQLFFSRILNSLKTMTSNSFHPIYFSVQKDISWWQHFVIKYSRKTIIPNEIWDDQIGTWSLSHMCAWQGGAWDICLFFQIHFPEHIIKECRFHQPTRIIYNFISLCHLERTAKRKEHTDLLWQVLSLGASRLEIS